LIRAADLAFGFSFRETRTKKLSTSNQTRSQDDQVMVYIAYQELPRTFMALFFINVF